MKRQLLTILFLVCAPAFVPLAHAHAFMDRAVPAVGRTVHGSPAQVQLWFSERLEPVFSTVQVLDRGGKRVDSGDARVDPSDATLLRASLPPLAAGTYRVKWRVVSADSHVTEGDFTFDVAP